MPTSDPWRELAVRYNELVELARQRKLPTDATGGSIATVTNFGAFGSSRFIAPNRAKSRLFAGSRAKSDSSCPPLWEALGSAERRNSSVQPNLAQAQLKVNQVISS